MRIAKSILLLVIFFSAACESSSFKGDSDNEGSGPLTGEQPGTLKPSSSPSPNSVVPENALEQCLKKKADNFNISIVIDNSNSTDRTDPQNFRQKGALSFADKFNEFAAKNPSLSVNVSVIAFWEAAVRGKNGWIKLTGANIDLLKQDITTATTNSRSGTLYVPPFTTSGQMFTELGAAASKPRERNLLVFMSDGYPHDKLEKSIALINDFSARLGVAVYAIAAGDDFTPAREAKIQSLALPLVGTVNPKHVGKYFRAASGNAMATVWDEVFAKIGDCE